MSSFHHSLLGTTDRMPSCGSEDEEDEVIYDHEHTDGVIFGHRQVLGDRSPMSNMAPGNSKGGEPPHIFHPIHPGSAVGDVITLDNAVRVPQALHGAGRRTMSDVLAALRSRHSPPPVCADDARGCFFAAATAHLQRQPVLSGDFSSIQKLGNMPDALTVSHTCTTTGVAAPAVCEKGVSGTSVDLTRSLKHLRSGKVYSRHDRRLEDVHRRRHEEDEAVAQEISDFSDDDNQGLQRQKAPTLHGTSIECVREGCTHSEGTNDWQAEGLRCQISSQGPSHVMSWLTSITNGSGTTTTANTGDRVLTPSGGRDEKQLPQSTVLSVLEGYSSPGPVSKPVDLELPLCSVGGRGSSGKTSAWDVFEGAAETDHPRGSQFPSSSFFTSGTQNTCGTVRRIQDLVDDPITVCREVPLRLSFRDPFPPEQRHANGETTSSNAIMLAKRYLGKPVNLELHSMAVKGTGSWGSKAGVLSASATSVEGCWTTGANHNVAKSKRLFKQLSGNPTGMKVVEYLLRSFHEWVLDGEALYRIARPESTDDVGYVGREMEGCAIEMMFRVASIDSAFSIVRVRGAIVWASPTTRQRLRLSSLSPSCSDENEMWCVAVPGTVFSVVPMVVGQHLYLGGPLFIYPSVRCVMSAYNVTSDYVVAKQMQAYRDLLSSTGSPTRPVSLQGQGGSLVPSSKRSNHVTPMKICEYGNANVSTPGSFTLPLETGTDWDTSPFKRDFYDPLIRRGLLLDDTCAEPDARRDQVVPLNYNDSEAYPGGDDVPDCAGEDPLGDDFPRGPGDEWDVPLEVLTVLAAPQIKPTWTCDHDKEALPTVHAQVGTTRGRQQHVCDDSSTLSSLGENDTRG